MRGIQPIGANIDNDSGFGRCLLACAKPDFVIPVLVTGIHCAAHSGGSRGHDLATIASARRAGKWAPVTSTGVTPESEDMA